MKNRLNTFLRWLFPDHYSETAKCVHCDAVVSKTRMVHDPDYGWFCNEEELGEYWLDIQW